MLDQILLSIVLASPITSANATNQASAIRYAGSFQEAKSDMYKIYSDNRVDQYCGCKFDRRHKIDIGSCGYSVYKSPKRALRTEAEHVVAAATIGKNFSCWRDGGRSNCMANDKSFLDAHNDLHNLMPVLGEVNMLRSNYNMTELGGGYGQFGSCEFKVDSSARYAEPPPGLKGDIARINFYMHDQYGVKLSERQARVYMIWAKQDPVSTWERTRDERIRRIQGNSNPYVSGR